MIHKASPEFCRHAESSDSVSAAFFNKHSDLFSLGCVTNVRFLLQNFACFNGRMYDLITM